ncbi:MAG: hypothetical protein H7338_08680 [Candidatus Sericytochromatia bacterium]|nr:hypothetical protein [Candidatus Sericytochromatia bacterium]
MNGAIGNNPVQPDPTRSDLRIHGCGKGSAQASKGVVAAVVAAIIAPADTTQTPQKGDAAVLDLFGTDEPSGSSIEMYGKAGVLGLPPAIRDSVLQARAAKYDTPAPAPQAPAPAPAQPTEPVQDKPFVFKRPFLKI